MWIKQIGQNGHVEFGVTSTESGHPTKHDIEFDFAQGQLEEIISRTDLQLASPDELDKLNDENSKLKEQNAKLAEQKKQEPPKKAEPEKKDEKKPEKK